MLNKKLTGARGAALIYALMFFLMCALVGSIVVTAAFANTGRLRKMREEQQEYLAVRSAAQLVADMMSNGRFYCDHDVKIWPISATDASSRTTMVVGDSLGFRVENMEFINGNMLRDVRNLVYNGTRFNDQQLLANVDGEDLRGRQEYYVPAETKTTFQVQMEGLPSVNVTVRIGKGNDLDGNFTAHVTAVSESGNYRVALQGETNSDWQQSYQYLGGYEDVMLFINHIKLNWTDWKTEKGA